MMQDKKSNPHKNELYISVDIEAAGPIPAEYSMLSIGACDVKSTNRSFYIELKPISEHFVPEALAVSGLSLGHLEEFGIDPVEAMGRFSAWIDEVAAGFMPVFVGFNAPFDWQFINWYFYKFLGKNPFGINAIDIKAYYMGFSGSIWFDTSSSRLPFWIQPRGEKKHNALDDALAQAEIFAKLLKARHSSH